MIYPLKPCNFYLGSESEDLVLDLVQLAGGQDANVTVLAAAQPQLVVLACNRNIGLMIFYMWFIVYFLNVFH